MTNFLSYNHVFKFIYQLPRNLFVPGFIYFMASQPTTQNMAVTHTIGHKLTGEHKYGNRGGGGG